MADTAILVMGMQKDFIEPEMGNRALLPTGKGIVPAVVHAVSVARQRGNFVVWVVREHDRFGRDIEMFRKHIYDNGNGPAIKGTKGAEIIDDLMVNNEDYKLVKTRFSAFFNTNLHSLLQRQGIKNLVIVGIQTSNCIRQTAYDAVALDYQSVTVIADATAATTPEVQAANMRDMKKIRIATPTLEEWCNISTQC